MATVEISSGKLHMTVNADSDDDARNFVQLVARAFKETGGMWMRGTIEVETDDGDGSDVLDDTMVRWFPAAATEVVAHFDAAEAIKDLDIPGLLGK